MSTSSIKKRRDQAPQRQTAEKESPTRSGERYQTDPNPEQHSIGELCEQSAIDAGKNVVKAPQSRRRKNNTSNPLSSLLSKSYTYLSKKQIEEQAQRFQSHKTKRLNEIQQKAEELEQIRQRSYRLRQAQMRNIPTLTEKTQQICKAVPNSPLYDRYERELERSRQELQAKVEQAERVRQQRRDKEDEEMKELEQRLKLKKTRTSEQFFQEQLRWKRRRQQKLQGKRQERSQLEVKDLYPQPKISDRSKRFKHNSQLLLEQRDARQQCTRFTSRHQEQM